MRLFLGIPLPDPARRRAAEVGRLLGRPAPAWRFVPEAELHLTLRFLGEVDPARCSAIDASSRIAASGVGPIALQIRGAGVFPGPARPRILWLGVEDRSVSRALLGLAARLERSARALGFAAEDRPFAPHLTVARARARSAPPVEGLAAVDSVAPFEATRLVLFRSESAPGGAHYVEEAVYPLDGDVPA